MVFQRETATRGDKSLDVIAAVEFDVHQGRITESSSTKPTPSSSTSSGSTTRERPATSERIRVTYTDGSSVPVIAAKVVAMLLAADAGLTEVRVAHGRACRARTD